jgi:hypothetical protein
LSRSQRIIENNKNKVAAAAAVAAAATTAPPATQKKNHTVVFVRAEGERSRDAQSPAKSTRRKKKPSQMQAN